MNSIQSTMNNSEIYANARENPNVRKPKEREILLVLGKIYQQLQYIFQPRETTYRTKLSHHKTALKFVPQFVQLYEFAENGTSKNVHKTSSCTLPSVRPTSFRKLCKSCLENRAFSCLDFHAKVCCCTAYMDPYSTACPNKYNNTQNKKCLLGICALALLGNVPTCCSLSSPNSPQKSLSLFFSYLLHTTQCILLYKSLKILKYISLYYISALYEIKSL
jgi:hypothetical protein